MTSRNTAVSSKMGFKKTRALALEIFLVSWEARLTHSIYINLLSGYYVPDNVLDVWGTELHKTENILVSQKIVFLQEH